MPRPWRRSAASARRCCKRELSPERPIAILSGNDIEHALLGLAAMYIGVPYAPISPAYSLISQDFGKLRSIMELLTPGLVFTADGEPYRRAIEAVVPPGVEVVVVDRNPLASRPATLLQTWLAPTPTADADAANAKVGPDSIVKFLFTSGSTGTPKAVINTQRIVVLEPGDARFAVGILRGRSRRSSWTGRPGTTPPAATTISASCSTTAAPCTSTRASRCRG